MTHPTKRAARPSDAEIAAVRALIGYRNIAIDGTSVRLARRGMALTLNGIAQGYATERCLKALAAHGIADAFLNTGEIGIAGRRERHEPWTAAIADPRQEGAYIALARPLSGVLATSGDYATAFTADFKANHIFDPETLRSPERMASASVIARLRRARGRAGHRHDGDETSRQPCPCAEAWRRCSARHQGWQNHAHGDVPVSLSTALRPAHRLSAPRAARRAYRLRAAGWHEWRSRKLRSAHY